MTGIYKETFYKEDPETRIGAVIADGQWYFFEKWRSTARVKAKELDKWIKDNKYKLIVEYGVFDDKKVKTYRTDVDFIKKWYKDHNTPLDREIIPNNYPPRIWNNKTETQNFLDNPRTYISKITFSSDNEENFDIVRNVCKGCGYIASTKEKELEIYCLNADYVDNRIKSVLDKKDYKITTRRGYYRRDINDFDDKFLKKAYEFYLPFVRNTVRKSKQTIEKFLPDKEDRDVQYIVWINEAMSKYDETLGRPFAGYLDNVLNYWPYNLPVYAMGRELNDFNKTKNEVYSDLVQETRRTSFTDKELADAMNITLEEYKKFDREYQTWLDIANPTSLDIEDSGMDRLVSSQQVETSNVMNDFKLAHQISVALLKTSIDLGDYANTTEVIKHLGLTNIDLQEIKLEDKFKDVFQEKLKEVIYAEQKGI